MVYSGPFLSSIGILALFLQTLESRSLSLKTLEFQPYFFKHYNSGPIFKKIGILALSFGIPALFL